MAKSESKKVGGSVWTIVVAGGSGRRFGSLKQFAELGGRRVVDLSLEVAHRCSDGVVLVVPAEDAERVSDMAWPRCRPTPR